MSVISFLLVLACLLAPLQVDRDLLPSPNNYRVMLSDFSAIAIASGETHTCVIVTGGAVKCWGLGGAVGSGNPGYYNSEPAAVPGEGRGTIFP